ncbi:MAG: class D beta-lactamase [Gemmatimonadaceae bacterium]|nr:class D beta-lactamase [Chitinophagaceae bacterium]
MLSIRLPLFFVFAVSTLLSSCSPNNVNVDEGMKKWFDSAGVTGTFGLYDNGQGNFTVYNLARFRDSAYLPASTFKIVNSLIGLETGRIKNDSMVINWDGIDRGRPECNKDMSMYEAFRLSCPPWYQELARRIGKDTMQQWLDTLGYAARYGKFKITNNLDTFWLDNSMKITADEELGLVKKLYFNQLPFQKTTHELVKKMMLWEDDANYRLSYKTGMGTLPNGHSLGWIVGWIEENRHPYMFVLHIETDKPGYNLLQGRMAVLKSILREKGFFQGKK